MQTTPAPRLKSLSPTDHQFFRDNGYLLLPNALSPADLQSMLALFDNDFKQFGYLWRTFGSNQNINCDALASSPDVDAIIRHPKLLGAVTDLMAGPVCFSEIGLRHMPPYNAEPGQSWHRDRPHWPKHPLRMDYIQVMIYLTDVSADTHCFSISPESVDQPVIAEHPLQLSRNPAVDIHGPAGTVALFNISALHTATVRRTTTQRKTIQIYYGHLDRPALSPDSFIPATFWHSHADPAVRQFYSKLTDKTKIFLQGTGLPGL